MNDNFKFQNIILVIVVFIILIAGGGMMYRLYLEDIEIKEKILEGQNVKKVENSVIETKEDIAYVDKFGNTVSLKEAYRECYSETSAKLLRENTDLSISETKTILLTATDHCYNLYPY